MGIAGCRGANVAAMARAGLSCAKSNVRARIQMS